MSQTPPDQSTPPRHVVICPDSWKESLAASDVARAIRDGFAAAWPSATFDLVPVADGGEGTVDALVAALGGVIRTSTVTGPDGSGVTASWGLVDHGATAVVEMAAASGLGLVSAAHRDPVAATSRGTGELLRAALDEDVERIIVGLGGSATVDGGAGMLAALGVAMLEADGAPIPPGGGGLLELAHVDVTGLDDRLETVELVAAVDVDNRLSGPDGAAVVFGPQKGASDGEVEVLRAGLERLADVVLRDLGVDLGDVVGGGAAGGMGAVLDGVLGADLRSGIEVVVEAEDLVERIRGADLVVVGEGRMDGQSLRGKAPVGVARVARDLGVPVIALVGSIGPDVQRIHDHGIDAVFSVVPGPCTLDEALAVAHDNVVATARNVAVALGMFDPRVATADSTRVEAAGDPSP